MDRLAPTPTNADKKADYTVGFTDQTAELRLESLPTQGDIPHWLRGTLIRNSPGKFWAGTEEMHHWFDGLAMPHSFMDQLVKVDAQTGKTTIWAAPNCHPGEPVFVPAPNAQEEDDGVT
ncbi:MAG TPA: carotenoid oxygenase family protein [Aggregatilineales bacterium]|nr:carotenoid oxygenase family protein [Anaerolineales bacterium]HRE46984.1 carotenoid oxygenase family protein [Aggregatilineales bacterium]